MFRRVQSKLQSGARLDGKAEGAGRAQVVPNVRLPMFAECIPNGAGFTLRPGKPQMEVGPADAARILHVSMSSLPNILARPMGQKFIRWRWLTDAKGKRVYESASLNEYIEASRDPELAKGLPSGKA